jgi:hypothetical protein
MTLVTILDVISSCVSSVLQKIVDAFTEDVVILLVTTLDMKILSEGTNCPLVDVTNTKLLDTGRSSS